MNKTNTIIKPYLRKFILQTHPDFFHNDVIKKQTNASSLQTLQNILQPQNNIKATTCQLEFFTKQQKTNKKKQKPQAVIQFNSNDSEWSKTYSFFNLCKQVEIPILQSDLDIVNDMISQELNKNKPKGQYKSLTKEFAERLYKQHNELNTKKTIEWTPNQILGQKLIMFDPTVNKKLVANQLSSWLPYLHPERWWGKVPIMVISPDSEIPPKELTSGILVIRSDMTLEDLKKYFDTHLDEIIKESYK